MFSKKAWNPFFFCNYKAPLWISFEEIKKSLQQISLRTVAGIFRDFN